MTKINFLNNQRQEKQDQLLELEINLKQFEISYGKKFKKWTFIVLVLNLLITLFVVFIAGEINNKTPEKLDSKEIKNLGASTRGMIRNNFSISMHYYYKKNDR